MSPSTAPARTSAYRPDIDGLRAIAILLVLINHFFREALPGGFIGVDVFFVISGFLITGIISTEMRERRFNLGTFYARRVLRLFPALATMLVLVLLVGLVILSPEELALLGKHVAASAAFVINFVLVGENGYFDLASDLKPLLHMWSLGVEEQFYLVWPLVLLVAIRLRLEIVALAAILALSLYLNVTSINREAVRVFFLPEFRGWEFAAGGLLALAGQPNRFLRMPQGPWLAELGTLAGIGLIAASAFLIDAHALYPGWRAVPPVVGAVLLLAAGNRSRVAGIVLSNPVSRYIGHISYPLYLWHWPVVAILTIVGGPPANPVLFLGLLVAFLLATATYHFVETPLRHRPRIVLGHDIRVLTLASAVAVTAVLGLGIMHLGGLSWRIPGYTAPPATDYVFVDEACSALAGSEFNYCRLSDTTRPPTIALLGDSHANHFFEGVAAYAAQYDERVINLGGCLPLPDTAIYQDGTVDGCIALGRAQLDFALNQPDIQTILVAGRMAYWITGTGVNGLEGGRTLYVMRREVDGRPLFGIEAFESGLRALIDETTEHGKRLVLVLDNPELDFPPASCLSQRPMNLFQRDDCSVSREMVDYRQRSYRAAIARVLADNPSVATFDPMTALCNADRCEAMAGGNLLYRDDNHLSIAGSLFLSRHYNFLPM